MNLLLLDQKYVNKIYMNDKISEYIKAGKPLDRKSFMAFYGLEEKEEAGSYEINEGIAVIKISGCITQKASWWSCLFDESSCESIKAKISKALSDPNVREIVLDIDSPGGEVPGVQELASFIYQNRKVKKCTAFSRGLMASAAYWIGAACGEVILNEPTSEVGSIGVIFMHFSLEEMYKKNGINVTAVTSGKKKAVGSPYKNLSKEDFEHLKKEVDGLANIFISEISKFRNTSIEQIENLEATCLCGQKAIEGLLADKIMTLDNFLSAKTKSKRKTRMDIETLKANHPEIYNQIIKKAEDEKDEKYKKEKDEEAKKKKQEDDKKKKEDEKKKQEGKDEKEKAVQEGIKKEASRIAEIQKIVPKGMETFCQTFISDSSCSLNDAKLKIADEIISRGGNIKQKNKDESDPVNPKGKDDKNDFASLVDDKFKKVEGRKPLSSVYNV